MHAIVVMSVLLAAAAAPTRPASPPPAGEGDKVVRHQRTVFGTVAEIVANVTGVDQARASGPFDAAFEEVARVEALVDEDNPRSAVWAINQGAGGDPIAVDPELFNVLAELQRLAKVTKGAFDVTAAVYDDAWHFDAAPAPTRDPEGIAERSPVPRKADIDRARKLVGFDDLVLDPAARTARLKTKGARIGVRAVSRGYALERAAAVLEESGVRDFIIIAAGDLVVRGKKGPRPWMVGIQDPRAAGHFAAISSGAAAIMTTGDYEDFFFDGGVRYHDVIDPRTGLPAVKCRSVTIVAKSALTAEGLSRAVFVLGPKDGLALVERLKSVDAVIVTSDNRVVVSKSLKGSIQHRPPTDGL